MTVTSSARSFFWSFGWRRFICSAASFKVAAPRRLLGAPLLVGLLLRCRLAFSFFFFLWSFSSSFALTSAFSFDFLLISLRGDVQDGGRHGAGAGDQAGEARGELAVGAAVDGEQQALEVRHEAAWLRAPRARAAAFPPCGAAAARSAQRSIGGIAIVVITAMATIIVKRFWLSTPIDRPIVATITSVEPRAFMPQASASDSRRVSPPSLPPTKAPANLPTLAMTISPSVSSSRFGSFRIGRGRRSGPPGRRTPA